jgi:serine/threonine protein kinase
VRGDGTLLFTPRQVFLPLAASCTGGIAVILLLARDREVAYAATAAFGVASLISLLLATVWGRATTRSITRVIAVGALGASATLPGWYFGPSSAYAGIVASLLLFAGVVLGGRDTPFPTGGAWAVAVGLIGGQATVAVLVFAGVLRDASLLPVIPPGGVVWHHVAAHATVLAVYATAFAIGRQLHKRYWQLSEDLDVSTRAVARREALLDEARAEYRRTFALGREGVFAGHQLGRYQLGELIGRGGAGEVYSARDVVDGTVAAVKLLRADQLADHAKVRGFLDEATQLTKIASPNVVHTKHVGGLEAELPYIAMEQLTGDTLAQLIAKRGRLDRTQLRGLIEGGCNALAATHAAGVVHGDVSPTNLVLEGATWKLIDFGLGSTGTQGTPRFVSPERLAGAPPSVASDLYGFAACLYTAITGNEPFAGVRTSALPAIAARELPMDPRLHAEVSSEIADVLALALGPDPALRWSSASDLGHAFTVALDGGADDAIRARLAAAPAWSVSPPLGPSEETSLPARSELDATDLVDVPARLSAQVLPSLPAVPPSGPNPSLEWLTAPATDTSVDTVAHGAWRGAFAERMRIQYAYVLAACVVGAGLILAIAPTRWMLGVALVTIGIAAVVVGLEQRLKREWPWTLVAALAIGPAYVFGLHSGFVAVLVVVLFIESSFTVSTTGFTGRGFTLGAVLVTHAACFVAIQLGVLPDDGVTPVLHHQPGWTGWAIQGLVLGVYVTAFAMGRITQQRYAELVRRNETAARQAAHQQALLASARAEVDRVLAGFTGGLFTGSTIGGFAIGRLLGRGGMGEVYAATKATHDVALKVIRADKVGGSTLRRFALEAQALTRVDSPYVARVIEVGTEDGRLPYMAMERVHGTSLAEILRERERLELADVRSLVREAARGLADVHRAGVVHRDLKPSNVLRTTTQWKLVDFGVAMIEDAPRATTGNVLVGTPAYMAPEQLLGGDLDPRTDLYALCLVLYRVIVGRPAFTQQRVTDPRSTPADPYVVGDLPIALCHALRVGLAALPGDRFQTATELEAAFEAALDGRVDEALATRARSLATREPWRSS